MAAIAGQSDFHILICLIEIWTQPDVTKALEEPSSPYLITDIDNIDIIESYQKLIGTAQIRFPRGTIIKRTTTEKSVKDDNADNNLLASIDDAGVVKEIRTNTYVLNNQHISVGNRIRIYLGYTTDPKVANMTKISLSGGNKETIYNSSSKLAEYKQNMKLMFNGYIAQCSVDMPITIKCENLAYGLKKISCPDMPKIPNATVNDILAKDGKCDLLKDTGIELYPGTEAININIGNIGLNPHMTVADVLNTWSKRKLYTFLKEENGKLYLAVGRIYSTNIESKDNVIMLCDSNNEGVRDIDFAYHVAENGLTIMKTDPLFIACEASYVPKGSNQFYRVTIRRNPKNEGEFEQLNETKITKNKRKAGLITMDSVGNPVDLSNYTVVTYFGAPNCTQEQLVEEAKKYLESFNQNGIDGSLTIFGDLALHTGAMVKLIDNRYTQKNGVYLVEEVHTKFGVNGYRQIIKLPFCLGRSKNE